MSGLVIRRAGPQMTVQDLGRPGFLAVGLSRGGAADRLALFEAAALLGDAPGNAALEMAGAGGTFEATGDLRIALTGAPMPATIEGRPVQWNASHTLAKGETLTIGAATGGVYGYLSVGGGIDTGTIMESRATHLAARIGAPVAAGDTLPVGPDPTPSAPGRTLDPDDRFRGGSVRLVPGGQTEMFSAPERARFEATTFTRDLRGNRQGVRLAFEGGPFEAEGGRSVLSEIIVPGDVQMTGDGTPYVLLPECQTTGGYPRIGSVHPNDLARVAQAAPGTALTFNFVTREEALGHFRNEAQIFKSLSPYTLVRDPHDIDDLLSYQLVSGATTGEDTGGEDDETTGGQP